jgi:phosphoglycerol transferase MdoB-like AlkP superfamily enzyme
MDRPFVISQYASNQTEGLAAILQKLGYHTSFMHGGSNGTMDFDKFCYMSGFQEYYGRNEYPDPKDFDGHWGISDEPYLKYAANKMSEFAPPFFNAIFTLSSHHPYEIPFKYQGMFPKGSMEIEQSIAYADFALKGFFEEAKQQDWYNNTLFVITADHTSMSEASYYQRQIGNYAVPIIFYSPSDSSLKGFSKQLAQHIDIMPSILDYLNYPKTYYCFGTSLFDANRQPFYINYLNDRYVFAKDDLCCIYYDEAVQAIYKWKSDSSLKKNLINNINVKTQFENRGLDQLKAVIQTYNNDFIDNKSNPQAYQNIEIESHDKH